MRKRIALAVLALVLIGGGWLLWTQYRSQQIVNVWNAMNEAQTSSQVNGSFDAAGYVARLQKIDTSSCPSDFRDAFEDYLRACQGISQYKLLDAGFDVIRGAHGGKMRVNAEVDHVQDCITALRKSAEHHGVTFR